MRFSTVQNSFFFGALALATFGLLWLLGGFLMPIIWALILGIVFFPLYTRILHIFKNKKSLASLATLSVMLVLLFAPLYGIGSLVAREAIQFYTQLASNDNNVQLLKYSEAFADLANSTGIELSRDTARAKAVEIAKATSATVATSALEFGKSTTSALVKFFLMLYLLFFVFRDGALFGKRLMEILPLGDSKEIKLFQEFTSVVRAIFKGTLAIALIQGLLGGITLWLAGADNVVLWATVMTILAVIPAVGPAIILAPVALVFLFTGSIVPGVVVLVGLAIVSVIDNLLRPALVGREIQMHDVLIMLSVFGGLATFGFTGFVIGPVIMGLFITLWGIFEDDYKVELKERG